MGVRLSIVIAASRPDALARCLDALARQRAGDGSIEAIVVHDDGFRLPAHPAHLRVVAVPSSDRHPSRKRNDGATRAAGAVLAFIDDDVMVPEGWAAAALDLVGAEDAVVAGGPNADRRPHWRFRLAQVIQENVLLEGLTSHRDGDDAREVGVHELPLCNMVVPRAFFQRVGGFAPDLSYFLDDVDFNWRARRAGAKLLLSPRLAVHHDLRPLVWPYLRYKFRTRFMIGLLKPRVPHLYRDAWQLRLVHASWGLLLPLSIAAVLRPRWAMGAGLAYLVVLLCSFGARLRDPAVAAFGPLLLAAAQLSMYFGYTTGRLAAIRRVR